MEILCLPHELDPVALLLVQERVLISALPLSPLQRSPWFRGSSNLRSEFSRDWEAAMEGVKKLPKAGVGERGGEREMTSRPQSIGMPGD